MRRNERAVAWRGKINPIFVLAIQYLRLMPRFFRALAYADAGAHGSQVHAVVIDACRESLLLLPAGPTEQSEIFRERLNIFLASAKENELLADPVTGPSIAEVLARIQNASESLLKKGFQKPHWWMTQKSWPEFLREADVVESMLNALSLLQLKTPLHELTRRVASGDSDLYMKLFQPEGKPPDTIFRGVRRSFLDRLTDQATKIVGTALLLKGEPPGYQLPLRMILFFGWDFGLRDLSIKELHAFLVQMQIIPESYEPETLRKYRHRLRQMIDSVSALPVEPNRTEITLP